MLPFTNWDGDAVSGWLERIGLGQYAAIFESQEVDGELLDLLSDADLDDDLGVHSRLHRKKILLEISRLKQLQPELDHRGSGGAALARAPAAGGAAAAAAAGVAVAAGVEQVAGGSDEQPLLQADGQSLGGQQGPSDYDGAALNVIAMIQRVWRGKCARARARAHADGSAWLCCETDRGFVYWFNLATRDSTFAHPKAVLTLSASAQVRVSPPSARVCALPLGGGVPVLPPAVLNPGAPLAARACQQEPVEAAARGGLRGCPSTAPAEPLPSGFIPSAGTRPAPPRHRPALAGPERRRGLPAAAGRAGPPLPDPATRPGRFAHRNRNSILTDTATPGHLHTCGQGKAFTAEKSECTLPHAFVLWGIVL